MDRIVTPKKALLFVFITLCLLGTVKLVPDEPTFSIEKKHNQFYRFNSTVNFNHILEFGKHSFERVVSIGIRYNMVYSNLEAEWMINGQVIHREHLPRGLNQSLAYPFDQHYPGDFSLRLIGNKGQMQMISVSAIVERSENIPAGKKIKSGKTVEHNDPIISGTAFFEIISPSEGDNWEIGKRAVIAWKSAGIYGKVACELFKDRNRISLLSRQLAIEDGQFSFTPDDPSIIPGRGYQIRLTTLVDNKSYLSRPFGISEEAKQDTLQRYSRQLKILSVARNDQSPNVPMGLRILSPSYQDKWHLLSEHVIRWESEGLEADDDIVIALRQISGQNTKILAITKNSGEFRFLVPYPHIFIGFDIQVILTPIRERSIEVASDPFVIMRPMVDLIPNTPTISYQFPQQKSRKWWQVMGDLFSGGLTLYVEKMVELSKIKADGTTMRIDLNVINKGLLTRQNVCVECSIQTTWGNVLYSFDRQTIATVYPDLPAPVTFSGLTKDMHLDRGKYYLEVEIDPDNKLAEREAFRKNNRLKVEFEIQ